MFTVREGDRWTDRHGSSWTVVKAKPGEDVAFSGPGPCRGMTWATWEELEQGKRGWKPKPAVIKTKHRKAWCELCQATMLMCATCGNNCCNGGYGTVDGKDCPDCPNAYDVQDAFWKDRSSVEFV